jgi:hypothetical protein
MTDRENGKSREPEGSPYGPQPHGVDEASGGADSSPFENLPSGEKGPAAEKAKEQGKTPGESQPESAG